MKYEAHQYASLMPWTGEKQYRGILESMRAAKQYDPNLPKVMLYQGKIIDGRTRQKACQELGIDFPTEEFSGTDEEAIAFVEKANLFRRQMDDESETETEKRFALARTACMPAYRPRAKVNTEVSGSTPEPLTSEVNTTKVVASNLGVSTSAVKRDKHLIANCCESLLELVKAEQVSKQAAKDFIAIYPSKKKQAEIATSADAVKQAVSAKRAADRKKQKFKHPKPKPTEKQTDFISSGTTFCLDSTDGELKAEIARVMAIRGVGPKFLGRLNVMIERSLSKIDPDDETEKAIEAGYFELRSKYDAYKPGSAEGNMLRVFRTVIIKNASKHHDGDRVAATKRYVAWAIKRVGQLEKLNPYKQNFETWIKGNKEGPYDAAKLERDADDSLPSAVIPDGRVRAQADVLPKD